jgi:hypothetical protein
LGEREDKIASDMAKAEALAAAGEKPSGEQMAAAEPGGEQSGGEQSGGEQAGGEQAGGEKPGGQESGGKPSGSKPSGGKPSGEKPSGGQPAPMPAGVPLANVPIREASQLAAELAGAEAGEPGGEPGSEAGSEPGSEPGTQPGMGAPSLAPPKIAGKTSPFGIGGGTSQGGTQQENQAMPEMGLLDAPEQPPQGTATPNSTKDAEPGTKKLTEKPWFAKLPPDVRNAIRASSERRPPRGYEETLKKYFENTD